MATYLKLTQYKNPDGTPYFREVGLYLGTLHARKGNNCDKRATTGATPTFAFPRTTRNLLSN